MDDLFNTRQPDLPPPVRMPDPDDPQNREATRRRRTKEESLGGRESTNLTGADGGVPPPYTGSTLGT